MWHFLNDNCDSDGPIARNRERTDSECGCARMGNAEVKHAAPVPASAAATAGIRPVVSAPLSQPSTQLRTTTGAAYHTFLETKRRDFAGNGATVTESDLPAMLFPFQCKLVQWALRKGRCALWTDTGTGKTLMQTAWASHVPGRVLILAPLCVSAQTIREAEKIGVKVGALGSGERIEITNYEQLHHVSPLDYSGVVLDESSILKALDGKTRKRLTEAFASHSWKLCCTATPAPNDIAELANHCEFLGIMTRPEMLATFFLHIDQDWVLKKHGRAAFYRWLASWGMFMRKPSDLGFSDDGYALPPLSIDEITVEGSGGSGEYLFPEMGLGGIRGRMTARRGSLDARVAAAHKMVSESSDQWIVWCGLNDEQDAIASLLGDDAVSVSGADSQDSKIAKIQAFTSGASRVLVSKPKIAGFGLNLQNCHNMAFLGLGDSYEAYYQAIRRCYRFGQTKPVRAVIVVSEPEREIIWNVRDKERQAQTLASELVGHMAAAEMEEIGMTKRERATVERKQSTGKAWTMNMGDCVEVLSDMEPDSVDLSVYSPPFQSLYTYTNSEHDIGNCSTDGEFMEHFRFVIRGLLKVTKPGRLSCCHIAQTTTTLSTHGVIGLKDLRGAVISAFIEEGWIYHGDVCIDKDPQAQAIRTHSKALLFVQLKKDASWLRPALADFIEVFRKPGENAVPIHPDLTNNDWIEWARPIWYGINGSDTLSTRRARSDDDARHICPLQLGTIERCVRLWSNPGEVVLSPFAGIGSEGYESVRLGRRFIGAELKREYFEEACRNLSEVENSLLAQGDLLAQA